MDPRNDKEALKIGLKRRLMRLYAKRIVMQVQGENDFLLELGMWNVRKDLKEMGS